MKNSTRYLIVIVISILMNELLYMAAMHFNLPVWFDITGTALAAYVLEPAAGLIVGLVNNFWHAIFDYSASSIFYYAVSAAVALIVGLNMRRQGKSFANRLFTTIVLVIVSSAVLSTLLTLWRTGGIPDAPWEMRYFDTARGWGWPTALACFFGTFVIKIFDTLASALLVSAAYGILPRPLKYPPRLEADRVTRQNGP